MLADRMVAEAERLRIAVRRGTLGETLADCGASAIGGIEAGRRLAETCMAGLGEVTVVPGGVASHAPWQVAVRTSSPVVACLASQYAGWALDSSDPPYFALGSGPARALARKEPIFADLSIDEAAERGVLVLETAEPPPPAIVRQIAEICGLSPAGLTILYAPTTSLAGSVQVVARVAEVALHKAHELKFPLARIVDALGSAPLPPPHPDFATAMGRTNDAIIFGGQVQLFVTGPAEDAAALAKAMPSARSRDFGLPFAEVFRRAGGDFHAIDRMLFSPALALVTALETGETFRAGRVAPELLDASFK